MDNVFFLDSAGNAWETCSPDDLDAVAFGPRGCARRVPEKAYIAWINNGMGGIIMDMNTVKDMDKVLGILDAEVAKRKIPFDVIPERTGAEYRALAEDHEEYVALLARERKVINAYFNAVQMQEWAQNHKRWIETGLDGYTTHELSPVGKETLNRYLNKVVEETWWDANEDRLMTEFESSRQYLGDDDRNFEWYINREYETYLRNL